MGAKSKRKGKLGELEAAKEITRLFGVEARRSQQYSGNNHDGDLCGLEGVHVEVKRCERLELYGAVDQAVNDSSTDDTPLVLHRRNGCDWLAICRLDDLPELVE